MDFIEQMQIELLAVHVLKTKSSVVFWKLCISCLNIFLKILEDMSKRFILESKTKKNKSNFAE